MIDHGPIIFHLLCTPVIFFSVYFLYRQSRRYGHSFLTPYLYFVLFDGLGGRFWLTSFFASFPFSLT